MARSFLTETHSETGDPCAVVHECPDCGLFSRLGTPAPGIDLRCGRCGKILRRVRRNSLTTALACCLAALIFYALALTTPYMQAWLYDSFEASNLMTGPLKLDDGGFWILASIVALFTVAMPLMKVLGTTLVLLELRKKNPPRWTATLFGWLKQLNTWSMIEVFLLGYLVAYTRLQVLMRVEIDVAAFALFGLMLAMAGIDAALDPEAVWEEMKRKKVAQATGRGGDMLIGCDTCHEVSQGQEGESCPRCGDALYVRKPDSINHAWAFTLTAALLYIPSNYFPIMTVVRFGRYQSYTIFAGLEELVHIGMWPLAVLVFTASIVIPLFKLISMTYLLIETHLHSRRILRHRTRLYRLIDFIGRWSMVDVFMVSILVALVHFGAYARITAEMGALYFTGVVIFTMLAVDHFDPRLMWDAAAAQKSSLRVPA